ncbi:GreA/GreB family elongation factor [Flavimarina sp. Hel_I_48]|uniref:GreA/GreB family elongation factor n=1 Tax=Flavimarina sp. Hel_I_48 TaxID=1392488 RepID=UPI0004DF9609|nr:GreA/GreB family elongation factor [Flavimarina sp. Hel_I_48]
MSRGFVKEDDQEEAPIIPPRAALPEGAINYVTPYGLQQLHKERDELEGKIASLDEDDERERRRAMALLNGNLNLLLERIHAARVLEPENQNHTEIRFGAWVTYTVNTGGKPIKIQIVGVDEADVKKNKIAFTAPIAIALTGKKAGDEAVLNLGKEKRNLHIEAVAYEK